MAYIRPQGYFKNQTIKAVAQVVKWFISFSFFPQSVCPLVCPPAGRGRHLETRSGRGPASNWLLEVSGRGWQRQKLCHLALFLVYPEDLKTLFCLINYCLFLMWKHLEC